MALRYGGEVNTRSIDPLAIASLRASPCLTTVAGPIVLDPDFGQFAMTTATAAANLLKGLIGARSNTLWGLLCDRSIAKDAPDCLVMMSREKAHQRTSRVALS
jgi:hypothetical protein